MVDSRLSFSQTIYPPSKRVLLAFELDAGWSLSKNDFRNLRSRHSKFIWVGVNFGNEQIGIARLELAQPEFCYVSHLIILKKFRRMGIGRFFIQEIEKFVFSFGIRHLMLTPKVGSLQFYEALHFTPHSDVAGVLKKEIFFMKKWFVHTPS